ncbi:RAB6-interacting golgin - like 4 [Theobroma cacao]|nr:RAB6-interacting golgin - like 4 [Theobroma cacao]
MATPKQIWEQQQSQMQRVKNSGINSGNGSPIKDDKEEEMAKSALASFRAKEEEIERKKMEVRDKVQAYMGRVEEATRRLADIREELDSLIDPMRKEVANVRKKIDTVNRELKPLGQSCQKKVKNIVFIMNYYTVYEMAIEGLEREYKEALEAFNDKNKEKAQLVSKLMELVSESEKLRMTKLDELSKNIETLR